MSYLLLCVGLKIRDFAIKGTWDVEVKLNLCLKCLDNIQDFQKQPEKFSFLSSLLVLRTSDFTINDAY